MWKPNPCGVWRDPWNPFLPWTGSVQDTGLVFPLCVVPFPPSGSWFFVICGAFVRAEASWHFGVLTQTTACHFLGSFFWVTGPNPARAHQAVCLAHVSIEESWKSESRSPELLINAPPLIGTSFRCWTSTSSFEIRKWHRVWDIPVPQMAITCLFHSLTVFWGFMNWLEMTVNYLWGGFWNQTLLFWVICWICFFFVVGKLCPWVFQHNSFVWKWLLLIPKAEV